MTVSMKQGFAFENRFRLFTCFYAPFCRIKTAYSRGVLAYADLISAARRGVAFSSRSPGGAL